MAEQESQEQPLDLNAVVGFVDQASTAIAQMQEQIKQQNSIIQGMQQHAEPEYRPEAIPQVAEEDLESMSNSQLLNHLESRVNVAIQNGISQAVNPLQQNIDNQRAINLDNQVNSEISTLQKQYPDFQHFANKTAEIVKQRSDSGFQVSIEDAYKLAKSDNPDMVTEFTTNSAPPKPTLAGGLLPTSRLIGDPSARAEEATSFEDAAERAFQEEVVNEGLTDLFRTEDSIISHSPPTQE